MFVCYLSQSESMAEPHWHYKLKIEGPWQSSTEYSPSTNEQLCETEQMILKKLEPIILSNFPGMPLWSTFHVSDMYSCS